MRMCIACEKRVTTNNDGVCDVCKGHAGYDLDGYLFKTASLKASINIERESSRHENNFQWVKLKK